MQTKRYLHQFLVPAYKNSPHLRECLKSLKNQELPSQILISTSTPFDGIADLAEEFNAEIHIHNPNQGIAHDWNIGLENTHADWVTIAHQDDVYMPNYTKEVLEAVELHQDAVILFTNYAEILEDGSVRKNAFLIEIKKVLLNVGFLGRNTINDSWSKKNVLRFGSPIPCPSVTLRIEKKFYLSDFFEREFRLNMDWAAWLKLAKNPGGFVWVKSELMHHRIHQDSETSDGIKAGHRKSEDLEMLCRLWPKSVAKIIATTYAIAYRSNSH